MPLHKGSLNRTKKNYDTSNLERGLSPQPPRGEKDEVSDIIAHAALEKLELL